MKKLIITKLRDLLAPWHSGLFRGMPVAELRCDIIDINNQANSAKAAKAQRAGRDVDNVKRRCGK